MRLRLLRAVLLVCAVLPFAFGAGATEYMCRDISLAEGLSQSYVSTIDRDDVGFLWIGTRFGLNRYDSEKIKNYYSSLADENTLPHSNIRKLFVDSNNRIFVACEYGAAIYRRSHDDFVRLYNPAGGQLNVRSFFEEENGVLIGSRKILLRQQERQDYGAAGQRWLYLLLYIHLRVDAGHICAGDALGRNMAFRPREGHNHTLSG